MCGRYAVFTEEENQEIKEIINEINERFKNGDAPEGARLSGEIFPTNRVPVITRDGKGGRQVNLFKWGFPNFKQPGAVIINARSETLEERPTFRSLLFSKRCLIPASAFYEWKKEGEKKEKYLIRRAAEPVFYMAGLYNSFTDKAGQPFTAFVIITAEANTVMSEIHNRMPVVLPQDAGKLWLSEDITDLSGIKKLLLPWDNEKTVLLKAG